MSVHASAHQAAILKEHVIVHRSAYASHPDVRVVYELHLRLPSLVIAPPHKFNLEALVARIVEVLTGALIFVALRLYAQSTRFLALPAFLITNNSMLSALLVFIVFPFGHRRSRPDES